MTIKERIIAPVWEQIEGFKEREQTSIITSVLAQEWPRYHGDRDLARPDARAALKQFRKFKRVGPLEGLGENYYPDDLKKGKVAFVEED